jgi:hypothetical protein
MSCARCVPRLTVMTKGDPELFAVLAPNWLARVEASPAFLIPITRHPVTRFSFGVCETG